MSMLLYAYVIWFGTQVAWGLLNYVALSFTDRVRPIVKPWTRRLLVVFFSTVISIPLLSFGVLLGAPLVFIANILLVRWLYGSDWRSSAIRGSIWSAIWLGLMTLIKLIIGLVFVSMIVSAFRW